MVPANGSGPAQPNSPGASESTELPEALESIDLERAALQSYLEHRFAAALGFAADEFSAHVPLRRLGLDSITVAKLRVTLETDLSTTIPMEILSSARTVTELARQLYLRGCRVSSSRSTKAPLHNGSVHSTATLRAQFLAFRHDLTGLKDDELTRLYASLREDN
jgi:acyl carrier protein